MLDWHASGTSIAGAVGSLDGVLSVIKIVPLQFLAIIDFCSVSGVGSIIARASPLAVASRVFHRPTVPHSHPEAGRLAEESIEQQRRMSFCVHKETIIGYAV